MAAFGLSACGDYIFTDPKDPIPPPQTPNLPAGSNAGGTGSPQDAISRIASPISFTATAHQGLEITNVNGGVEAAPTLSFDLTTTGFDMKTSDGTVRYDTRTGSTDIRGTNSYRSCVGTCTTDANTYDVTLTNGAAPTLQYATYGIWTKTTGTTITRFAAFAVGAGSTAAQVPATGSATFTGQASGLVLIDGPTDDLNFSGAATLTADFGAKTVSGGIANITTRTLTTAPRTGTMNNISFTGGTINGAAFSGTASAVAATNPTVNLTGTTGTFSGTFYGPQATEAAGSFVLSRNGLSLVGSFGAAR
jgi:hypothetical protein